MSDRADQLSDRREPANCSTCGSLVIVVTSDEGTSHYERPAMASVAEVERLQQALIRCATIAGADVSDGPPTSPTVDVWAVREVNQLRTDSDEAGEELWAAIAERDRYRDALEKIGFCPACDLNVNACVCELDPDQPQNIARTALHLEQPQAQEGTDG